MSKNDSSAEAPAQEASSMASSFVNRGLKRWEETRAQWLKKSSGSESEETLKAAIPVEVDDVIDVLFAPRWRSADGALQGPPPKFAQSVPLPQMVDILVDLWEAEGLDM